MTGSEERQLDSLPFILISAVCNHVTKPRSSSAWLLLSILPSRGLHPPLFALAGELTALALNHSSRNLAAS